MAPPSTASAGARKLGSPAERCSVEPSFACHGWFARSPHSVGGAECGERASVVWGKPCGSRERRGRRRRRDSTFPDGFVPTTHTTSLAPAIVRTAQLPLSDGSTFAMPEYLKGQQQGTMWLRDKLERQIGMASFVEVWRARHRPHKTHPERGVKSFAFQEPESISRQAKARWCKQNGHAVLSLQHDGVVVAFKRGTDLDAACDQMRATSEAALGYEQPCERKDGLRFLYPMLQTSIQ